MKRKSGLILICTGAVFILMALSLFTYNRMVAENADSSSKEVVSVLITMMTEQEENTAEEMAEGTETDTEDNVVFVDGYEYIGVLTIADLGLELPVMSEWSYAGLKVAPGRYSGSVDDSNLVICAHNYESHFGNLSNLSLGDNITFTTMDGNVYEYEVSEILTIQPTAIEELMSGDWDLCLYTCTYNGQARVVVKCKYAE